MKKVKSASLTLLVMLLCVLFIGLIGCETKQYTVSFEGATVETQLVNQGGKAVKPADPVKTGDAQYSYTFIGWFVGDEAYDFDLPVNKDITITAKFQQKLNTYTVSFENAEVETQTVDYGGKAVKPADPVKTGDAQYSYTFIGWFIGDEEFSFETEIFENIVLTAKFQQKLNSYTVSFENAEVETQTVDYGGKAVKPADPVKAGDAQYSYTFIGWFVGDEEFSFETEIFENIVLTAKFEQTINIYTVNYYNGTKLYFSEAVSYGETAVGPQDNPESVGKTFAWWESNNELFDLGKNPVDKDYKLVAVYDSVQEYDYDFSRVQTSGGRVLVKNIAGGKSELINQGSKTLLQVTSANTAKLSGVEIKFADLSANVPGIVKITLKAYNDTEIWSDFYGETAVSWGEVAVKANDSFVFWGKQETYGPIYVELSDDVSIYIGIDNRPNTVILIDSIEFVAYDNEFSSLSKDGTLTVKSYEGGRIDGIISDDEYMVENVLKFVITSFDYNGIVVELVNPLDDFSAYDAIMLRLRSTDYIGVYVNALDDSNCVYWDLASDYVDIDLLAKAPANIERVFIAVNNRLGNEVFVDKLDFVPKTYYNFDFTEKTVDGAIAVSSVGGAEVSFIDDETATGGKALVASQQISLDERSGFLLEFKEPIDVSAYAHIYIYVRTEGEAYIRFLFNGTENGQDWSQYATYTAVDLVIGLKASSITTLTSVSVGDSDRTGYWYIDKIELVEKIDYGKSYSDVLGGANVVALGFVEDNDAGNNGAFKLHADTSEWYGQASILFDDTYTLSNYANVLLKIKVVGAITLLINTDNTWGNDATYGATFVVCGDTKGEYVYVNLMNPYINSLGTMNTIYFAKQGANTADIYIDDVIFTENAIVDYSPRTMGSIFGNVAYVADDTCESGYATRVDVDSRAWNNEYLVLDFAPALDPSRYQSIIVRIKADSANWLGISTDGWAWTDAKMAAPIEAADTWYEFDLMTVAEFRTKPSITMIVFDHGSEYACTAYVDVKLVPLSYE